MRLPQLPYNLPKQSRQITAFGGLNLTDSYQDGELRGGRGLSTARYPFLAQRTGRTQVQTAEDAEDIFSWDGALIYTAGGILYRDGEAITNVSPGKKQWAVVNTKLIVWPDMLCIDLTDNTFTRMDETGRAGGIAGSVQFTADSITAALAPILKSDVTNGFGLTAQNQNCLIYTYGADSAAVEACYDPDTGWNTEALQALQNTQLAGMFGSTGPAEYGLSNDDAGVILIPSVDEAFSQIYRLVVGWYLGDPETTELPDVTKYNSEGYYAKFTEISYPPVGWHCTVHFDIYKVGTSSALWSGIFSVGDYVNVTGTPGRLLDVEKVKVTAIDDTENKMTFTENTFQAVKAYYIAENGLPANGMGEYYNLIWTEGGDTIYHRFHLDDDVPAGGLLFVSGTDGDTKVHVWDPDTQSVTASYSYTSQYTGGTALTATLMAEAAFTVTVQRNIPQLDYICESGNRLWGVSNDDRTIYASALGLPWDFWTYGNNAGAWASAVGTDEDWTGICAYGGSVLCWKERHLHKVMGSYPAEYYYNTYEFPGVQAGSHRSMEIIDEVLYYKGVHGIYSYAGGSPGIISLKLGETELTEAQAGDDGRRYHLSARRGDSAVHYVYDTVTGLWTCEEMEYIDAFAQAGGVLHMLKDGAIYQADGSDERVSWQAELCPFDETALNRKGYAQLIIRFEMEAGSWMKIETQQDGGRWTQAYMISTTKALTKVIPLMIGRCDRIAVRFSGEGRTVLRSMVRQFAVMSEV